MKVVELVENTFKVGDIVCSKYEHKSNGLNVYMVIDLNPGNDNRIKIDTKSSWAWVDAHTIRYATEKEIRKYNLKNAFIAKETWV